MNLKEKKIGVLLGGMSAERDVSFSTGGAVVRALKSRGYDIVEIDAQSDLAMQLADNKIEVVYNALHGKYGEDGCIQGLLEVMKIPYTGSSVIASAMAMDKQISNQVFAQSGLPVPSYQVLTADDKHDFDNKVREVKLPVVIKPATEGSSVGISIARDLEQLNQGIEEAFKHDDRILLQQFVKGREISVAVIDGQALGTVEIRPKLEFYNYKAKYTKGMTEYFCPAPISAESTETLMKLAEQANNALGCESAVRVDFILDENEKGWLLEINTLPGLTETSLTPMIANDNGMSFEDLVEKILSGASLKMGN